MRWQWQTSRLLDHWSERAVVAGVIGAIALAVVMMVSMAAQGLGAWTFLNVIGATLPAFRPPSAGFGVGPTLTGLGLHLITGAVWALPPGIVGWAIAPRLAARYPRAMVTGVLYGGLVYLVMGRLIGPLIDPAVAMLPQAPYVIAHLVYGAVIGAVIVLGSRHEAARVTFAPEVEERMTSPWR